MIPNWAVNNQAQTLFKIHFQSNCRLLWCKEIQAAMMTKYLVCDPAEFWSLFCIQWSLYYSAVAPTWLTNVYLHPAW